MDVTEMVSEFVSLKRQAEARGALPSPDLVRWEVLRQGLLLAQTVPARSRVEIGRPWVRLETPSGVLDLTIAERSGDGVVLDGTLPLCDGERPVVLLFAADDPVPIPTRAVVAGPAFGPSRRTHLALPYLSDNDRRRLDAVAPPSKEIAR